MQCHILVMLVGILISSCSDLRIPASNLDAVFGASDLDLVALNSGGLNDAMGSLQVVLSDPEGGPRVALPFCTAFAISPRHIMTAAHCVKHNLIYNRYYVSKLGGVLDFVKFGNMVRLNFSGAVDERASLVSSNAEVLKEPEFLESTLDFAVFELPASEAIDQWVDLKLATDFAEKGRLLSFPNGVPLTKADCQGIKLLTEKNLAHDCDALSGSSGGLLIDPVKNLPIALHLAGPGANDSGYHEAKGIFESPQDFAKRRGCQVSEDSGEVDPSCVLEKGFNRALPLSKVVLVLQSQAPELWQEVASQSSRGPNLDR